FYVQPLSPTEAAARAKNLKELTIKLFQTIDNISFFFFRVMFSPDFLIDLRLLVLVWKLDVAARSKSSLDAKKYYSETC
ncbi:unnamed protein product, partial [Thlaspi arvense]